MKFTLIAGSIEFENCLGPDIDIVQVKSWKMRNHNGEDHKSTNLFYLHLYDFPHIIYYQLRLYSIEVDIFKIVNLSWGLTIF